MSFIQEYALLIAVTLPVVTILAMNLFVAIAGERTTLLLPGLTSFPRIPLEATDSAEKIAEVVHPANDEVEKLAA